MIAGGAPALRVTRAETRLTVHGSLPYGCSWQLVRGQKNVDLFVILGAFLFKFMHSFITVLVICIFLESSAKKKTRDLFGYSIARAKCWAVGWKFG